jgi:hypothetical protein
MTVGIAVACEDGKAIVVAADRLLGLHPEHDIAFEGRERKIVGLSSRVVTVLEGPWPGAALIDRIKKAIQGKTSVHDAAKALGQEILAFREERIGQAITKQLFGWTRAQFIEKQKLLHEGIVARTLGQIEQFKLGVVFLMAGIDDAGAHLLLVGEMGEVRDDTDGGFATVGAGADLSLGVLAGRGDKKMRLADGVFLAYEAKRASERCPSVGRTTDVAILRAGRETKFLEESTLSELDRVYKKWHPPALPSEDAAAILATLPD